MSSWLWEPIFYLKDSLCIDTLIRYTRSKCWNRKVYWWSSYKERIGNIFWNNLFHLNFFYIIYEGQRGNIAPWRQWDWLPKLSNMGRGFLWNGWPTFWHIHSFPSRVVCIHMPFELESLKGEGGGSLETQWLYSLGILRTFMTMPVKGRKVDKYFMLMWSLFISN